MLGGFFAMLGRLWVLVAAFFRGTDPPSLSVLPVAVSVSAGSRIELGPTRVLGKNGLDPEASGLREPKGQFLRHPSLGPSGRGHHVSQTNVPDARTAKWKKEKSNVVANPTFTIQDWSSLPAKDVNPPRRPPRPPSGPLPAVVVTPCSPLVGQFPSSAPGTPGRTIESGNQMSPKHLSPDAIMRPKSVQKDINPLINAPAKPPIHQPVMADSKVIFGPGNRFNAPKAARSSEFDRQSFVLPESLRSISFHPSPYTSNPLSAVSERLWDVPSWIQIDPAPASAPAPPHIAIEQLNARAASYITSTPAKKRRANELDLEGNYDYGSPTPAEAGSSPPILSLSLTLSDDQTDLPYPDVFDLDVYYDMHRDRSEPDISLDDEFSSSQALRPFNTKERPSSPPAPAQIPGLANRGSPKSAKRHGFVPEAPIPIPIPMPIPIPIRRIILPGSQEAKRYRDYRRQPVHARPPHPRIGNTSLDSDSSEETTPSLSPSLRSRVLTPLPPQGGSSSSSSSSKVSTSIAAASTSPRPVIPGLSNLKRDNLNGLSPIKEPAAVYPTPPIVIVSHHRFGSLSEESQYSSSDSESQDALREGLRPRL